MAYKLSELPDLQVIKAESSGTLYQEGTVIGQDDPKAGTFTSIRIKTGPSTFEDVATEDYVDNLFDGLGSLADQDANNVAITGGDIDGTDIGQTTPAAGAFTLATATNFITDIEVTAVSAGTTTLTSTSKGIQVFTGNSNHTVVLPVVATLENGHPFIIYYAGSGVLTISSSGGNAVTTITAGNSVLNFNGTAGTAAASWNSITATSTNTNSTIVTRDATGIVNVSRLVSSGRVVGTALQPGMSVITNAAGTTTLSFTSNQTQRFTGSTTQTCQMMDVATISLGYFWIIDNDSTANVTVTSSGGDTIRVLAPNTRLIIKYNAITGTTAASWTFTHVSADGSSLNVNNQTGTTYTFALTDIGGTVTASNAAASTYTLPQTSTVAVPIGSRIKIANLGVGAVTLVKEGAETLIGNPLLNSNAVVYAEKISATSWLVFGGTAVVNMPAMSTLNLTITTSNTKDLWCPQANATLLGIRFRAFSVGTAGTFKLQLNGADITGLTTLVPSTTAAYAYVSTAVNLVAGDVITIVADGTLVTVADLNITPIYTVTY